MKLTVGLLGIAIANLSPASLAAEGGATGAVTLTTGPHAGKYSLSSDEACLIAAFAKSKPAGFSVLLLADNASLSIDIPNVERTTELQIEFVVANADSTSRKGAATTKYVVDARPDSALESHQREERGPKGAGGTATVTLTQQTASATLQFSAQTSSAVKLEGTVECRSVDREYGR